MISYNHVCIFWGDIQVGIYRGVSEIREALLFMGWGAGGSGIPFKGSENIDGLKFFALS